MKYYYNCSQDFGYVLKNKLKDGKYKVYSKEFPDTPIVCGQYEDKRKVGKWTTYNPYTKSQIFQAYKDGALLDEKGIDSLGRITKEILISKDSTISKFYEYWAGGRLRYFYEYHKANTDKINISFAIYYYPNGQVESFIRYKNGSGHGKSFKYFENGQLKMEYENSNGQQVGLWKWWNDKGELIEQKDYDSK